MYDKYTCRGLTSVSKQVHVNKCMNNIYTYSFQYVETDSYVPTLIL